MAIQRSDLPWLNQNARSLQELLLGNQNRQDLMQQQGEQNQALQGMRGQQEQSLLTQRGQQEAEQLSTKHRLGQQALETNITRAQELANQNPNAGVTINEGGNVGITRPTPDHTAQDDIKKQNQLAKEGGALKKLSDASFKNFDTQFSTIENTHRLLDENSRVADKQIAVNLARLSEGQGQRLLQGVIQAMGAGNTTLQGSAQDKINYVLGTANSGFTPEQRNAIRKNLMGHANELKQQFEDAHDQFTQTAPVIAPNLAANGTLLNAIAPAGLTSKRHIDRLSKREAAYQQQSLAAGSPPAQPSLQFQPPNQGGLAGWLKGIAGGIAGGGVQPSIAAPSMTPEQKAARIQELLNKKNGQ